MKKRSKREKTGIIPNDLTSNTATPTTNWSSPYPDPAVIFQWAMPISFARS
jgi:hypothetical protein